MEQKYLVDSNVIIDYIGNALPEKSLLKLDKCFNNSFNISFISKIEVLGFNGQNDELEKLKQFIDLAKVYYVDESILDKTIELRKNYRIKLPDAIIAASAITHNFVLLIRNIDDFKNIKTLEITNPYSF